MSEVGSKLSPQPPDREWTDATWSWLQEQFEILYNEINNRAQLIYADTADSTNTLATAEMLKTFTFPKGVVQPDAGQQELEIVAAGTFSATASSHKIEMLVNGNVVAATSVITDAAVVNWVLRTTLLTIPTGLRALGFAVITGGQSVLETDLVADIYNNDTTIVIRSTSVIGECKCDFFKITYNRVELPQ